MILTIVLLIKDIDSGITLTLNSIFQQTYNDYKVVIVVSRKTDVSNPVFMKLRNNGNVSFVTDEGLGIYEAMNLAIESCVDSLVCFLGQGDFFVSENVFEYVNSCIWTEASWCVAPWVFVDRNSNVIATPTAIRFGVNDVCKVTTPVCHQSIFMHKKLLKALGGFNVTYKVAADRDLIVRAWKLVPPVILSKCIVAYLDGGYSAVNRELGHFELGLIQEKYELNCLNQLKISEKLTANEVTDNYRLEPFSWLHANISSAISKLG